MTGRGFLIRNPNWRKRRWHCRTPNAMSYLDRMNADKVLPSQMLVPSPKSNGDCRSASPISRNCSSPSRGVLPGLSRSTSPESPSSSNWWTQYSTVRGASPSNRPTSGQLIPCATSSTAWSRWSYRESRERRISSWRTRTIMSASAIVSFFMPPRYPTRAIYANNYVAMYNSDEQALRTMLSDKKPRKAVVNKAVSLIRKMSDRPKSSGSIGKQINSICLEQGADSPISQYHTTKLKSVTYLSDMIDLRSGSPKVQISDIKIEVPGAGVSIPKVGRNHPCPCGSGLKYKQCHGR